MFVGQWMTKDPVTVGPKESIVLARMIMRQRGIRRLPVVEGEHLVGIVTDRDVREAWASDATMLSTQELNYVLEKIPVRDIMSAPAITVTLETPLEEAVRLMRDKKVGGLPVVSGGALVGILTESDIFRAFADVLHYGNLEGRPDLPAVLPPPSHTVLVPVLGTALSQKVVRAASRLAVQLGLRLKVMLLLSDSLDVDDLRDPGDSRALDEIIAWILSEYRSIAETAGAAVETEFRTGDPAKLVLEEITTGHYDFMVVGRRDPLHLGSRLEFEKVGFAAKLLESSPQTPGHKQA